MKGTIIRNGIEYSGGGGSGTETGGTNIVEITLADYESLSEEEKNSDILYLITDSVDGYNAGTVVYDDTNTGLGANTVQEAIEMVFQCASESKQAIIDALTGIGITDVTSDMSSDELAACLSQYAVMKTGTTYTIFTYGSTVPYPDLTGAFNGTWSLGSATTQSGVRTATGVTEKAVDLTNVKTLIANVAWRTTGSRTTYATFGVQEVAGTFTRSKQISATSSGDSNTTGVITIDVSDLTGSYYLGCSLTDATYCMARISSITMTMK